MKRFETLKSKIDFDNIINTGKLKKNNYFSIYYKENLNNKKLFGIAVSKKLGNAVFRNKTKRQLRNIIDKHKNIFKNGFNYIIIIKKEGSNLKFSEKEKYLLALFEKGEK